MHFAAAAADNEQMAAEQDDLIESCGGVEVGSLRRRGAGTARWDGAVRRRAGTGALGRRAGTGAVRRRAEGCALRWARWDGGALRWAR